jgi:D-alanyl-D-alanine carboxypeptidase
MNNPFEDRTFESRYEKFVYGKPAAFAPGEGFNYSNAGFDMLGLTIEEASGMSFGDYFQQEIIEPLGLTSTYFKSSPGYPEIAGLVNGYVEHYPGEMQNCTHIDREVSEMGMGQLGVIANPYEFARFYQELIRGNVLEPATLEEMLTVEYTVRENVNMCLGIYYVIDDSHGDRPMYVHNGAIYGMQGQVRYFPGEDITMSMQVNTCWIFEEDANNERFQNLRDGLLEVIFEE